MYSENSSSSRSAHRLRGSLTTILAASVVVLLTFIIASCTSQNRPKDQQMIHEMGSQVMPFDLAKTQHIFEMTESGGIQQVIVRNQKDTDQLVLVREHLQHEAMRFSMGDYSDPTSLHGTDMPGIKDLEAGAAKIKVSYSELSNGAQLVFETADIHLITAIHRWFGAQLSDHGADATYK
jgi:hypothetical protein